jgi:hypothetical protein
MLSVMRKLTLALMILSVALSAQETWDGLRFGMTEAEVKAVLGARAVKPKTDELKGKSNRYEGFIVNDLKIGEFHGSADLKFDRATKRLLAIFIVTTQDEQRSQSDLLADARFLYEDYLKKYGKPVRIDGCATREGCALPYAAVWRDKWQSITLHILTTAITVEYETLNARKDI